MALPNQQFISINLAYTQWNLLHAAVIIFLNMMATVTAVIRRSFFPTMMTHPAILQWMVIWFIYVTFYWLHLNTHGWWW